ncbi:MAG: hypothetical protein LWY06_05825, partial [Firmicutes bacterium]|nr:hypothetical protein [Bacillota bacterium]
IDQEKANALLISYLSTKWKQKHYEGCKVEPEWHVFLEKKETPPCTDVDWYYNNERIADFPVFYLFEDVDGIQMYETCDDLNLQLEYHDLIQIQKVKCRDIKGCLCTTVVEKGTDHLLPVRISDEPELKKLVTEVYKSAFYKCGTSADFISQERYLLPAEMVMGMRIGESFRNNRLDEHICEVIDSGFLSSEPSSENIITFFSEFCN